MQNLQAGKNRLMTFDSITPGLSSDVPKLRFGTYPKHMWALSLFLVTAASVFLYHVEHGPSGTLAKKGDWWQYLFAGVVYALSIMCVLYSKVETVKLNHHEARIVITYRSLWRYFVNKGKPPVKRNFSDIVLVKIEHYGEFNGDIDTRSHKIRFEFKDGTKVSTLETRSKKKVNRRYDAIKEYLAKAAQPSSPTRAQIKPPNDKQKLYTSSQGQNP